MQFLDHSDPKPTSLAMRITNRVNRVYCVVMRALKLKVTMTKITLCQTCQTCWMNRTNRNAIVTAVFRTTTKLSYVMTCRVVTDINLRLHTLTKY